MSSPVLEILTYSIGAPAHLGRSGELLNSKKTAIERNSILCLRATTGFFSASLYELKRRPTDNSF